MAIIEKMRAGSVTKSGKARIFLFCGSGENGSYAERMEEMLLELRNCIVFRNQEFQDVPEKDKTAYSDDIAQILPSMQLVCAVITAQMLTGMSGGIFDSVSDRTLDMASESRSDADILSLARKNHIPVLPILTEPVDEDLYAAHFGAAHRLEFFDSSANQLRSFKEKLKAALDNYLTKDELRDEIRRHFPAYAFLSYRKADREHIPDLMKLLYTVPWMRRVAVWYDDQLSPGKRFDQEIFDTIHRSSVFILQVTPSLLNADNYVLNCEYPEALKTDLPVLPVIMEPVDTQLLQDLYGTMQNLTDGQDAKTLQYRLEQLRTRFPERFSRLEKPASPEEDYYFGIAYQEGIDVIVDRAYALACLERSASAGYEPAAHKLQVMYQEGIGVERSVKKAEEWGRLRETLLLNRMKQGGGEIQSERDEGQRFQSLLDYSESLLLNGQALMKEHEYPEAAECFASMINTAETYRRSTAGLSADHEFELIQVLAKGYLGLGDTLIPLGRYDQAENSLIQSVRLREYICSSISLTDAKETYIPMRMLSVGYFHLGRLYYYQGLFPKAEEYYLRAEQIRRDCLERLELSDQDEYEARRDYAVILSELGNLYSEWGKGPVQEPGSKQNQDRYREWNPMLMQKACDYYLRSLDFKRPILKENPSVETRRDAARTLHHIAFIEEKLGNHAQALEHIRESVRLREQLAQSDSAADLNHYLEALDLYVKTAEALNQWPEKIIAYQSAADAWDRLAAQEQASVRDSGKLKIWLSHLDKAADYYCKAGNISEKLNGGERSALQSYLRAKELRECIAGTIFPRDDFTDEQKAGASYEVGKIYYLIGTMEGVRTREAILDQIGMLETAIQMFEQYLRCFRDDQYTVETIKDAREQIMKKRQLAGTAGIV